MAGVIYSHANAKFAISTTTVNTDQDQSAFEALTYTEVAPVGSVGEYGVDTNMINYDTWNALVTQKAKGITNAGDVAVEVARDDADAGQIAMDTAGAANVFDNYAFKVTLQDGAVQYLRGLVAGPVYSGGRNEDFDLKNYMIGLNQVTLHVASP